MRKLFNSRKTLIAIAIVIAFVTVVVPTCRMVGCQMQMGSYMGFMHGGDALGFFSDCGGTWSVSDVPVGVIPSGISTLLLAFISAFFAATMLLRPQVVVEAVRFVDADPPPPPESPRGERLRV